MEFFKKKKKKAAKAWISQNEQKDAVDYPCYPTQVNDTPYDATNWRHYAYKIILVIQSFFKQYASLG